MPGYRTIIDFKSSGLHAGVRYLSCKRHGIHAFVGFSVEQSGGRDKSREGWYATPIEGGISGASEAKKMPFWISAEGNEAINTFWDGHRISCPVDNWFLTREHARSRYREVLNELGTFTKVKVLARIGDNAIVWVD